MPVQQQMSSFAKKQGTRVAQANAEHKDKPIDTGNLRLPPGIRNGVAKLSTMYTKEYEDDKSGPGMKGQVFFRASAIAMTPESHNGQKVAGGVTSVVIPMCDTPAVGLRKATTFSANWFEFQNLFKLLGVVPPNETQQSDPTGQKTEAYYFAAMKALVARNPPVLINFSTRGWTPKPTPQKPKPEEMVFETWHGLGELNGQHDPAAQVSETPPSTQPEPHTPAPTEVQNNTTFSEPQEEVDPADEIASLVEIALGDPNSETPDGAAAANRLEELAWAAGATKEQTKNAKDWAEVGEMALGIMPQATNPPTADNPNPAIPVMVGGKYKFAKRTKDGGKLKNAKGEEFPPQDVEVTAVDAAAKTCTVKSAKDGKPVTDIRTKAPVAVKFEWLES